VITSALLGAVLIPLTLLTFVLIPFWALAVAALERRRVRLAGGPTIADGHVLVAGSARRRWVVIRLGERATWRDVTYYVVALLFGVLCVMIVVAAGAVVLIASSAPTVAANPSEVLTFPTGPGHAALMVGGSVLAMTVLLYLAAIVTSGQSAIARLLYVPRDDEASLTLSRSALMASFEGELRRIERDLHDGAQQKLVSLSMAIGTAELDAEDLAARGADVTALRRSLAQAHNGVEAALGDLRQTVRAVHPHVLADHGLTAAVQDLAARLPLPVHVNSDLSVRLDETVELCGYFTVSESLTNLVRHSRARTANIQIAYSRSVLRVTVRDDGEGGADPRSGTGLAGLRERAGVLGGELGVSSPAGGPTTITLTVPAAPRQR
jgi:signal transduction histidine kinase